MPPLKTYLRFFCIHIFILDVYIGSFHSFVEEHVVITIFMGCFCHIQFFFLSPQDFDISSYKQSLNILNTAITSTCPHHVIPWHVADEFESDKAYFVRRQWIPHTLLDRIHSQPALSHTELRWFLYQLLQALSLLHLPGICHGDLKPENILVSSWGWLYITDFAIWKPSSLPMSYDSLAFKPFEGHHPGCYVAPERFSIRTRGGGGGAGASYGTQTPSSNLTRGSGTMGAGNTTEFGDGSSSDVSSYFSIFDNVLSTMESQSPTVQALLKKLNPETLETMLGGEDGRVRQPMDIFSLGCVVAAMYCGGRELFDIPAVLRYREGLFSPASQLNKIQDVEARAVAAHMTQLDPLKRWSARQYLQELSASGFFPPSFALLYNACVEVATLGAACSSDIIASALDQNCDSILHATFGDSAKQQILSRARLVDDSRGSIATSSTATSSNAANSSSNIDVSTGSSKALLGVGPALVSQSHVAMQTMKTSSALTSSVPVGISGASLDTVDSTASSAGATHATQISTLSQVLNSGDEYDTHLVNAIEIQRQESDANVLRLAKIANAAAEAGDPTIYTKSLTAKDLDPQDPYNDPVWVSYLSPRQSSVSKDKVLTLEDNELDAAPSTTAMADSGIVSETAAGDMKKNDHYDTSSSLREALPVAAGLVKVLSKTDSFLSNERLGEEEKLNEGGGDVMETSPILVSSAAITAASVLPAVPGSSSLSTNDPFTLPAVPPTLPLVNTVSIIALMAAACCSNVTKVSSKVSLLALCRRIAPYLDSSTILTRITPVLLAEIHTYITSVSSPVRIYGEMKASVMSQLTITDPSLFGPGTVLTSLSSNSNINSGPGTGGVGSETALNIIRTARFNDVMTQRERGLILSTGGIAADVISTLAVSLARVGSASSLLSVVVPGFVLPTLHTLSEASSRMPEVVLVEVAKTLLPVLESAVSLSEHRYEMSRRHILIEKKRIQLYMKLYPDAMAGINAASSASFTPTIAFSATPENESEASSGTDGATNATGTTSNTTASIPTLHAFLKQLEDNALRCGISSTSASTSPLTFADDNTDFDYGYDFASDLTSTLSTDNDVFNDDDVDGDGEGISSHVISSGISPAAALERCDHKLVQLSSNQVVDQTVLETMTVKIMSNIITSSYSSAKCVLMSFTPRLMLHIKSERLQNELVVYLSTLFNTRDWRLHVALIQHLGPICVIIGRTKTHSMLYNLLLQTLAAQRSEVVIASLHLFTQLSRVGLLAPSSVIEAAASATFLLVNPSASLRLAASQLILTAAEVCGPARSFMRLIPLLQPYVRVVCADLLLLSPALLFSVLKPALTVDQWNRLRTLSGRSEDEFGAVMEQITSHAQSTSTMSTSSSVENLMQRLAVLCPSANFLDRDLLFAVAKALGMRTNSSSSGVGYGGDEAFSPAGSISSPNLGAMNGGIGATSPGSDASDRFGRYKTSGSMSGALASPSTSSIVGTSSTTSEVDSAQIMAALNRTKLPSIFSEAIEVLLKSHTSSQDASLELLPFVLAHFRDGVSLFSIDDYTTSGSSSGVSPYANGPAAGADFMLLDKDGLPQNDRMRISDIGTNYQNSADYGSSYGVADGRSSAGSLAASAFGNAYNSSNASSSNLGVSGMSSPSAPISSVSMGAVTLAGILLHWLRILEGGSGEGQPSERLLLSHLNGLLSAPENRRFGMLLPMPQIQTFPSSQLEPVTAATLLSETDVNTRLDRSAPLNPRTLSISSFYGNCHNFVVDTSPALMPNRAAASFSASVSAGAISSSSIVEQYLPAEPTGAEPDVTLLLQKVDDALQPITLLDAHGFTADGKPKPRPPVLPRAANTPASGANVSGKSLSAAFRAVSQGGWARSSPGDPTDWRPAGALLSSLAGHTARVTAMTVPPDNSFVATGCEDGKIRIWESSSLGTLGRPNATVTYSFDDLFETPVLTSFNGTLASLSSGSVLNTSLNTTSVSALCSLDYAQALCAAGSDGSVRVTALERGFSAVSDCVRFCIDTATGTSTRHRFSGSAGNSSAFSVSSGLANATESIVTIDHFSTLSQSLLTVATHSGLIYGWDLRSSTPAFTMQQNHEYGALTALSVGPTPYCIQSGSQSGYVSIFDVRFQLPVSCWAVPSRSRITSLHTEAAGSWFSYQAALDAGGALPPTGSPLLVVAVEGSPDVGAYDISTGVCRSILRSSPTSPASPSPASALTTGAASAMGHAGPAPPLVGSLVKQPLGRAMNTSLAVERLVRSATVPSMVPLYTSGYLHCPGASVITAGSDSTVRFWSLDNPISSYRISGPAAHEDVSYSSTVEELTYKLDSAQGNTSAPVWVCEERVVGMDPTRVAHRHATHTEPISHLCAIQYPQKLLLTAAGKDVKIWM